MAQTPDREKALELALAQIDKNFGKGSVMRLGEEVRQPISVIPTGSIALDVALGIGGVPPRRGGGDFRPGTPPPTTPAPPPAAQSQAARPHGPRTRPPHAPRSSTPSTRWIPTTPRSSGWTLTRCWFPSPTPVSRRWRSPTC